MSRVTETDCKTLLHLTCVSLWMFKNRNSIITQEVTNNEFPVLVNGTISNKFCKKAQCVTFKTTSKKVKKKKRCKKLKTEYEKSLNHLEMHSPILCKIHSSCYFRIKKGKAIRLPTSLKNHFQLKSTQPASLSQIERNYFQGKLLLCQSSEMNLYSNLVVNEGPTFFPEYL